MSREFSPSRRQVLVFTDENGIRRYGPVKTRGIIRKMEDPPYRQTDEQ